MKKLSILILLMLLMGCSTTTTEEQTTTEPPLIDMFSNEFEVCTESCSTDRNVFLDNDNTLIDKIGDIKLNIINNDDDTVWLFRSTQTYERENLLKLDLYSDNYDIPILHPYSLFQNHLSYMSLFINACDFDTCGSPFDVYPFTIENVQYGFTETEGFYSYDALEQNGDIRERVEFQFRIDEYEMFYERIQYYPQNNTLEYSSFDGTNFKEVNKALSGNNSYLKINVDTLEFQNIYSSETSISVRAYSPEDGLNYYIYSKKDTIDINVNVGYYENMELISNLGWENGDYVSTINFLYMDGWDAIVFRPEDLTPYSRLLLNEVPVYDEYLINCYLQGLRYHVVKGSIDLTAEELESYVYPEAFTGTNKLEELKTMTEYLKQLEHPLNALGLTQAEFDEFINNQITILQNRYSEDTE